MADDAISLLRDLVEHDSYQTEYDGRMMTICPDCGEQEGAHRETCAFVAARAFLASDQVNELYRLRAEVEALRADAKRLTGERDVAIGMLAYWCVAVDQNGTGWDDWDEHYKDAMYRPCPIRELLDKEIDAARAAQGERG